MRPHSTLHSFLSGMGLFWQGVALWGRQPRLMALGAIPGLVTFVLMVVGIVTIMSNLRPLATGLVDIATDSDSGWVTLLEMVAALGIVMGTLLLAIYTFATVTLLVGAPFFERISAHIDSQLGFTAPEVHESRWAALGRGIGEGLLGLVVTIAFGVLLFLINLVPVVGSAIAFTLGASVGGWFLTMELAAFPASQRGYISRRQRKYLLRGQRARSLGFGVMTFVVFLVPGGAVLGMPAASAGATLLVRRATGQLLRRS
jgi:CysZ protein